MRARYLPAEIFTAFANVDLILHAGDIMEWPVIQELTTLAPVEAFAGNMDVGELRLRLPPAPDDRGRESQDRPHPWGWSRLQYAP